MNNQALEQAYVHHGDSVWFVSTMNRESSAAAAYGHQYAETLVWEMKGAQCVDLVWQGDAAKDSLRTHDAVVRRIRETGDPEQRTGADG